MVSTTALVSAVFIALIFATMALVAFGFCALQGLIRTMGSANPPYCTYKFLAAGFLCFCVISIAGGVLTWLVLCGGSHLCATLS